MLQKTILNEPETDRKTGRGIKVTGIQRPAEGEKLAAAQKLREGRKLSGRQKQNWPPVLPVSWMYWTGNTVRSTAVT